MKPFLVKTELTQTPICAELFLLGICEVFQNEFKTFGDKPDKFGRRLRPYKTYEHQIKALFKNTFKQISNVPLKISMLSEYFENSHTCTLNTGD